MSRQDILIMQANHLLDKIELHTEKLFILINDIASSKL